MTLWRPRLKRIGLITIGLLTLSVIVLSFVELWVINSVDYVPGYGSSPADARAIAYLELRIDEQRTLFGVGIDPSFVTASLKAIVCALSRAKIVAKNGVTPEMPTATATAVSTAY